MAVDPIPCGFHTATPYLVVDDAAAALDFYVKAFGATVLSRMGGPAGKIMHAEIQIGDSKIMLSDEFPGMGNPSPKTLGGSAGGIHLYVADVDAGHERALAAGATSLMGPMDMFWGDRFCKVMDPFGHLWSIATHKEDLTPEEMEKRACTAMAEMAQHQPA